MTELTIPQIEEIAARRQRATPGKWEIRFGGNFTDFGAPGFNEYCDNHNDCATELKLGDTQWDFPSTDSGAHRAEENARFVVACSTDVPALCSTVLSAIRERDALRAAIEGAPHNEVCPMQFLPCESPCEGCPQHCVHHPDSERRKCGCWKSRIGAHG